MKAGPGTEGLADTIVYLNGEYVARSTATITIEDRGTLFGDGVYEVFRYYQGKPLAWDAHLARLRRSLEGIQLDEPPEVAGFRAVADELIRRNNIPDAKVYWQITRGPAPRSHLFPSDSHPTMLALAAPAPPLDKVLPCKPWRAIFTPDTRWHCCWIKSLMLLPNVLAYNAAHVRGCQEAIFHRDGIVTEGSATNVFAVRDGALLTHPANAEILGGITRSLIINLAREVGIEFREELFTVDEMLACDEVFLTGTTTHLAPIVEVDRLPIADGRPGPIATRLSAAFKAHIAAACGIAEQ